MQHYDIGHMQYDMDQNISLSASKQIFLQAFKVRYWRPYQRHSGSRSEVTGDSYILSVSYFWACESLLISSSAGVFIAWAKLRFARVICLFHGFFSSSFLALPFLEYF